jgi:hypothetical protein
VVAIHILLGLEVYFEIQSFTKVGSAFTEKYILLRQEGAVPTRSANAKFVGRFQRRSAAPANDGGTVAAGQRIVHLFGAIRAVK